MAERFALNMNTKVKATAKPITDGEYTATITSFLCPETSNPYIVITLDDGRTDRIFINSAEALQSIMDNINRQVEHFAEEEESVAEWFEAVQGSKVKVWFLTVAPYQNKYLYKPVGFDESIEGLL